MCSPATGVPAESYKLGRTYQIGGRQTSSRHAICSPPHSFHPNTMLQTSHIALYHNTLYHMLPCHGGTVLLICARLPSHPCTYLCAYMSIDIFMRQYLLPVLRALHTTLYHNTSPPFQHFPYCQDLLYIHLVASSCVEIRIAPNAKDFAYFGKLVNKTQILKQKGVFFLL